MEQANMKQDKLSEAYDSAMQAVALLQISVHCVKNEGLDSWKALELFKTLHQIIGESSGLLAELLDERMERQERRKK
jgi:hypothetical protein